MKKKRKGFGAFKLTASAMAFGLIAGVVFQGYNYVMVLTGNEPNSSNGFKVAEVKETSSSKDAIIPTNTSTENSVVTDVSGVVDSVMPSIVAINSSATETSYDLFGREVEQPVQGSGSGIIIGQNNSELLIVTNNHVINGATSVQIVFADKKKASATIKGADANADLAVLSVNMKDLSDSTLKAIKVAVLGKSEQVKAGDMAIAIGNALGYGQSVTVGYISAVNREVTIDNKTMTLLQTDAAINPGNSGGALLNTQGQVIGINSVKYASEDVEGMGYAIPISSAIPMINELMNRQTVTQSEQGFLGLDASTAQNVTDEYANRFNMPIGIYVNNVVKNSPAQKAGLKQGDIITGLDNETIKTIEDLANALNYKKAGQTVDLKIKTKTNGEYKDKVLKITLAKKN
jgi:Trypsin-like serine proteases, typically periplasmic, contain C-terminal PDZ domain